MSDEPARRVRIQEIENTRRVLRDKYGNNPRLRDYEPVAVRILSFRRDHPEGCIATQVQVEGEQLLGQASVFIRIDGQWRMLANASKAVSSREQNARERAETGAVGRALSLCAYGVASISDSGESSTEGDFGEVRSFGVGDYEALRNQIAAASSQVELTELGREALRVHEHLDEDQVESLRQTYRERRDELQERSPDERAG